MIRPLRRESMARKYGDKTHRLTATSADGYAINGSMVARAFIAT